MSLENIIPALADISQDVAGPIPVELIQKWIESPQDDQAEAKILAPYQKQGTIVCSDAAGLSKMSVGKPLIEVLKLVSQPKEIIHAHGKVIGGQAVGLWVADNTQMFYDESIDPNLVVEQMVASQRLIAPLAVQVGIGIHKGSAFEIGGGLYGADADTIEEFTEEESKGREVIVSSAVKELLKAPLDRFSATRGDMHILQHEHLIDLGRAGDDRYYPAPFDRAFHEALLALEPNDQSGLQTLHRERVRTKNIVLVRIFQEATPRLLDNFAYRVATNTIIHTVARDFVCNLIKSNGVLAIFACDDNQEAVDLTLALGQAMKLKGLVANCAASRGEVLVFNLGQGQEDLAGSPVNVASKLAEDTPERGAVFIEGDELVVAAKQHGLTDKFEVTKSGVTLSGVRG